MVRKIIKIDSEKCNGCKLCVSACHEGAIGMKDGKAVLLRDDYCDGLGDCLPVCPTEAITFEERDTLEYNEQEVKANMQAAASKEPLPCGCPGSASKSLKSQIPCTSTNTGKTLPTEAESHLAQWPVQIKLVPVNAPYWDNADILIAADCAAYACGDFHAKFMQRRVTVIGCPKLDEGEYSDKLCEILQENNVRSVTVVRMEVPCCSGIAAAATKAVQNSGKNIPLQILTLSANGKLL